MTVKQFYVPSKLYFIVWSVWWWWCVVSVCVYYCCIHIFVYTQNCVQSSRVLKFKILIIIHIKSYPTTKQTKPRGVFCCLLCFCVRFFERKSCGWMVVVDWSRSTTLLRSFFTQVCALCIQYSG